MSRHRNVRSINYSEEYDGYDDVYGHSVEDDYCISPSDAAFIYDREGSRSQQKISAFFKSDENIAEEDETADRVANLDDVERAKLNSCLEKVKSVLNEIKIPEQELISLILKDDFEVEKTIDAILSSDRLIQQQNKIEATKEKDFSADICNNFKTQAKISSNSLQNFKKFDVPNLFSTKMESDTFIHESSSNSVFSNLGTETPKLFNTNQKSNSETDSSKMLDESISYSSLSSLVSNHLKQNREIPKLFDSDTELPNSLDTRHKLNFETGPPKMLDGGIKFSSLSSLVSNHLKQNKEAPKLFRNEKDPPKLLNESASYSLLSSSVSNHLKNKVDSDLKNDLPTPLTTSLTDRRNAEQITGENDWHIDLSSALCNSPSIQMSKNSRIVDNGEFVPQFVDCLETKNKIINDNCKVDISDILLISSVLEKSVSEFGKILTMTFRLRRPKIQTFERKYESKFGFDSPSPDDFILKHLRRK